MDRHAWRQVGCILAIALAARLGAAALWHERAEGRFFFGDSETYWQLARTITRGEAYRYSAKGYDARVFRTPGYPLLLTPLFLLGGDHPPMFWARVQGAVFGALAAGAVWWLAGALFGSRAALAAGLVAAVYPGAVATSAMVLTETPFSIRRPLAVASHRAVGRPAPLRPRPGAGVARRIAEVACRAEPGGQGGRS